MIKFLPSVEFYSTELKSKVYKKLELDINLYKIIKGRVDWQVVDGITLRNDAIQCFIIYLLSTNTYFECRNVITNDFLCVEKIRPKLDIYKLYIVGKMNKNNFISTIVWRQKRSWITE